MLFENEAPFAINLQLFADGDVPVVEPAPTEIPSAVPVAPEIPADIPKLGSQDFRGMVDRFLNRQASPAPEPAPAPAPVQEPTPTPEIPAAPTSDKMLAGKFKTAEDLEKSYLNIEKAFHLRDSEISQLRNQVAELTTKLATPAAEQPQPTINPTPAPTPSQQALESAVSQMTDEEKEAFSLELFEDPLKAMTSIFDKMMPKYLSNIEQKVQPIVEQRANEVAAQEANAKLNAFAEAHPDIEEYATDMASFINENPDLRSHPKILDLAYNNAKAIKTAQAQQSVDVESLKTQVISDPDVQKKIIADYLASIQAGKPPVTIGGAAGNPAVTPASTPGSLKEAGLLAAKLFSQS